MNGSFIQKSEIDNFLLHLDKKDNSIFVNGEDRKSGINKSNKDISTDSEPDVEIEETPFRYVFN